MSFGGFGGFGQNNNNQSSGFGGFGSTSNNQSAGFGSSNTASGFGSSTAPSNPFGGFGSNQNTGGFGSNNNTSSLFGNNNPKSTFGTPASTGGSMFGSTNTGATGGFGSGGFGSNNNASSGFNFGQKSNTFGGGASGSSALFGSGSSTSGAGGFGSNQTAGFGGSGTALNQPVPPSEGTGSTPFSAYTEKDGNSTTTNHFQSITFMQPYQKYSFEELRLADYNAGRKTASSGQAGAFGQSTGFGGFGQQNTSFGQSSSNPFGQTSSSATPFGQTSTSGGFGSSNTGGGLFSSKPATGGLFGSAQQTSAPSSGGLFGSTTGGSAGFGGLGNNSNTGGSLFSNQNQPSKPGGLFGTNTTTSGNTGFGGFGAQNTGSTGGGVFGSSNNNTTNPSGGLFGQSSQPQQPGGLFGQSAAQKPAFGGFGSSTSQPQQGGGLFGGTGANASGGPFGQSSQPQQSGGLFGSNNQTQSGGLFGSTQNQQGGGMFGQKPAGATGLSGFGGSNTQQANAGGLFGNTNNQQGSSLFGGNQQNKPVGGGLFGSSFGPSQNQQAGNSLFGQSGGSSLFGGSQQNQQPQQPQGLRASLLEGNPYGASSIWSGLPPATSENKGPLVTPLSASQKLKESQSRSSLRYSPVSRLYSTPPRRTGYGFSYSTYGTPSSASSTPGTGGIYGRGFTGGSFGRSLTKSFSSSSLRQQFSNEGDGLLTPAALGPGSSRYSSGSIRRLTIDRSLKTDLFARSPLALPPASATNTNGVTDGDKTQPGTTEQPQKLKKRVSFDQASRDANGTALNGVTGALVRTESDDTESAIEDSGVLRSSKRQSNGSSSSDSETSRGKELAAVPEDRVTDAAVSNMKMPHDAPAAADPRPGEYWMKPSRAELGQMARERLQNFKGFTVGRQGCGSVTFDEPVDLARVPLDDLYGKIVDIGVRSITVYPDASSKPSAGSGLNVPSTLRLENSWPRARGKPSSATSGPVFDKHVRRLREVKGTEFVSYETQSGIWTFRVPHYTRYGLDYDDEDAESELSSPPEDLATPRTSGGNASAGDTPGHDSSRLDDDTFGYKKTFPGSFGQQAAFDDADPESFIEHGSVATGSDASYHSEMEVSDDDMEMAGSFPWPGSVTDHENRLGLSQSVTPGKRVLDLNGDWAEQLQRTISPRKQDREALRDLQSRILIDIEPQPEPTRKIASKNEFRTSIDVMNSLFGQHEARMSAAKKKQSIGTRGFEWPYPKRAKAFDSSELSRLDQAWHATFKPNWTSTGQLVYSNNESGEITNEPWSWSARPLLAGSENEDLKVASLVGSYEESLSVQQWRFLNTDIGLATGVPHAKVRNVDFDSFAKQVQEYESIHGKTRITANEFLVWKCAHILFDDYDDQFTAGLSDAQKKQYDHRIRKDRFCLLWELLILEKNIRPTDNPNASPEELALYCLSVRDIEGACRSLINNGDYHLATLVSEIGNSDTSFRENIQNQLTKWKDQSVISEMTDEIRTLYELLAGNTTICEGKPKASSEDYASTFTISERWDFDWLQSFGLVLFYGILQDDPIEAAVARYAANLESGHEIAFPSLENHGDPSRIPHSDAESPFWVLLKIYAEMKGHAAGQRVVLPQAISLSRPFDCRLTFQLHHALSAHQDDMPKLHLDVACADRLAMELAFQYSAAGLYLDAIYALLFLSNDSEREAAIKDTLCRHAPNLPEHLPGIQLDVQQTEELRVLDDFFKIPLSWRCEAKALFCRSNNESELEYRYLMEAGLLKEAHDAMVRRVAPRMLINKEYGRLFNLLDIFNEHAGLGKQSLTVSIPDFTQGVGVYLDFLGLLQIGVFNEGYVPKEKDGDVTGLCSRMQASLHKMESHIKKMQKQQGLNSHSKNAASVDTFPLSAGGSSEEALQMVACKEMGTILAESMMRARTYKQLLGLPVLSSVRSTYTKSMSIDYYRGIMSGAH